MSSASGLALADSNLLDLISKLRQQRDWVTEIRQIEALIHELKERGKSHTVRDLAKLVGKSKSWVSVSLVIMRGMRLYPETEKCGNRNIAHLYLLKKRKLRRLLES